VALDTMAADAEGRQQELESAHEADLEALRQQLQQLRDSGERNNVDAMFEIRAQQRREKRERYAEGCSYLRSPIG
jgi:hypothetical protein